MELDLPLALGGVWRTVAERAVRRAGSLGVTIVGVLLGGSAAAGYAPRDLDLFVLIAEAQRRRLLLTVDDVPVDLFIESAAHALDRVTRRLDSLLTRNFAEGHAVWDPRGLVMTLQHRASEVLGSPPATTHAHAFSLLLRARTLAEALDRAGDDRREMLEYFLGLVVQHTVSGFFAMRRQPPRGEKHAIDQIALTDSAVYAALVRALDTAAAPDARRAAARDALARVFGSDALTRTDLFGPVELLRPLTPTARPA